MLRRAGIIPVLIALGLAAPACAEKPGKPKDDKADRAKDKAKSAKKKTDDEDDKADAEAEAEKDDAKDDKASPNDEGEPEEPNE